MDDVDRRAGHLCDGDRAMHALGFRERRPRQRVILRRRLPLGQRMFDDLVDDDAVLGVHADQTARVAGDAHGVVDRAVVDEEHARIGHEQFEAAHALIDHRLQLGQPFVGQIGANQMESVIDRRRPLGLRMPVVERLIERLAFALDGEVDDGRRAAECRGARAGLERVRGGGAAERQLHVRVRIDASGDDEAAVGVDDFVGFDVDRFRDHRDGAVLDEDVGVVVVDGGDDAAVADDGSHAAA